MKAILPLFLMGALHAGAQSTGYVNFVRQNQQGLGVVWDMPVAAKGTSPSALALESGGALFQLWTIEEKTAKDHLLDQKLVGAYLPTADIRVLTLDPNGRVPRTRVDQPFTVEINVAGLLTGAGLPLSSTSVLLERHIESYREDQTSFNPAQVVSGQPYSSAYISDNGKTVLSFPASSVPASDPTKAAGEEHFVIHALSDGTFSQTQLASAHVQVWPVASGAIKGINHGDKLRFQTPRLELLLNDLYPTSDTYLMLYQGTQVNGATGRIVKAFPLPDRDTSESHVLNVTELDSLIGEDGTYTLALYSDTVYGRDFLCSPVTFTINRTLQVNAMQVGFSDNENP
ncbi:MAG: hypothetical protein Q8Q59_00545 [Luteolibacter sp.]|jgi:hypothetical protein|nr:hypothetical protein [Luteolibacter sp.]